MAAWGFLRLIAVFFVGLILTIALIVAAALGLFGVDAAEWSRTSWFTTRDFLDQNDREMGRMLAVVGALGTLVSGVWAIYKIWHFAEVRMPARIEEFLEHNDARLAQARPMLLQAIETPGPRKSFRAPIAFVGPLNDALKRIQFGHSDAASADLASAIGLLETKRASWQDYERQTLEQLVSAHVLRGVILAARASTTSGEAARALDIEAQQHFSAAVDLASDDPAPLYYRGRQSMRLAQIQYAESDFVRAIELTEHLPCSAIASRASPIYSSVPSGLMLAEAGAIGRPLEGVGSGENAGVDALEDRSGLSGSRAASLKIPAPSVVP